MTYEAAMNPAEIARINAKHSHFYLSRYSMKSYRLINVGGKPKRTIQEALAKASEIDARLNDGQLTFVDVVRA